MGIADVINEYQKKRFKMCIYGMGMIGRAFYKKVIAAYNLQIDFFSAANIEDVDIGEERKVNKKDLLEMEEGVLIFLLVEKRREEEIVKEFAGKENFKIITYNQIVKDKLFIRKFYEVNREKTEEKRKNIAVYTCVTNDYDDVHIPQYIDKDADYFVISDHQSDSTGVYQWIDIRQVVPKGIVDYKEQNRYCKMHGAEIFKEYRYSIYLDGSILSKGQISNFITKITDCGLALFCHPERNNIFEEGIFLYAMGLYDNDGILKQLSRYLEEGIPLGTGLFACGIIARDNRNDIATKIMHEWFYEYITEVKRDQLSFPYVLWKNGIDYNRIGKLGNLMDNDEIEWLMRHKKRA